MFYKNGQDKIMFETDVDIFLIFQWFKLIGTVFNERCSNDNLYYKYILGLVKFNKTGWLSYKTHIYRHVLYESARYFVLTREVGMPHGGKERTKVKQIPPLWNVNSSTAFERFELCEMMADLINATQCICHNIFYSNKMALNPVRQ